MAIGDVLADVKSVVSFVGIIAKPVFGVDLAGSDFISARAQAGFRGVKAAGSTSRTAKDDLASSGAKEGAFPRKVGGDDGFEVGSLARVKSRTVEVGRPFGEFGAMALIAVFEDAGALDEAETKAEQEEGCLNEHAVSFLSSFVVAREENEPEGVALGGDEERFRSGSDSHKITTITSFYEV